MIQDKTNFLVFAGKSCASVRKHLNLVRAFLNLLRTMIQLVRYLIFYVLELGVKEKITLQRIERISVVFKVFYPQLLNFCTCTASFFSVPCILLILFCNFFFVQENRSIAFILI